jgi:predicted anti-sigma-YlaC factor YlaD
MNSKTTKSCNEVTGEEISLFLEMEIETGRREFIELHISRCEVCRSEMNFQKRFLNTLGGALQSEPSPNLPEDFAKVVKRLAEVGVDSTRNPMERRRAMQIVAYISSVILVGVVLGNEGLLSVVKNISGEFAAIGSLFLHFFSEIATALLVFGYFAKSETSALPLSILGIALVPLTYLLFLRARSKITKMNSREAQALD